ncbi:MAG: Zn-ribbon domain-containing OB-fold protein [Hyphomonadaceae bacterium]
MTDDELITIPGNWNFNYNYFAGEAASRFFAGLRRGEILSTLCPQCGRRLVPARSFCDACYVETTEWAPVGLVGKLEVFTIVQTQFPGLPAPPFTIGYVTLDGADTAVLNFVQGLDYSDLDAVGRKLFAGPRVRAVFSPSPQGRILDFHFELAEPAA